jgi:hypothetical protein
MFVATLAALALLSTGCTAIPPTGPKMEQSINYASSGDDYACAGFPTFSIHSDWAIKDGDKLAHSGDGAEIQVWCYNRAKYSGISEWSLSVMTNSAFGQLLESKPAPTQAPITVAGLPAIELTYQFDGNSFTQLTIIDGDNYLQVQAETPGGPPSSAFQDEIREVLESMTIAES